MYDIAQYFVQYITSHLNLLICADEITPSVDEQPAEDEEVSETVVSITAEDEQPTTPEGWFLFL